jgi:hypothetical protein
LVGRSPQTWVEQIIMAKTKEWVRRRRDQLLVLETRSLVRIVSPRAHGLTLAKLTVLRTIFLEFDNKNDWEASWPISIIPTSTFPPRRLSTARDIPTSACISAATLPIAPCPLAEFKAVLSETAEPGGGGSGKFNLKTFADNRRSYLLNHPEIKKLATP